MTDDREHSVGAARAAADRDDLARWVGDFLRSPGSDNAALADQLLAEKESWEGPLQLPLEELKRLAGPPGEDALGRLGEDDLETVEGMVESISRGWEPPPFIVSMEETQDGPQLVVEDGNHRVEALRRSGTESWWSIVGFARADDRRRFADAWGSHAP